MIADAKIRWLASVASLLLVLHPAAGTAQSAVAPTSSSTSPYESAVTQLDHISIAAAGKGSPIILIPGLACPRAVWEAFVPQLARTHRVYVVQVNGFGGDDPRGNLKPGILDGIVADLNGFIARKTLRDVAVVGHSMGGLVGMMLAKAHPADIDRLMVVDSLPYFAVLMAPPGIDPTPAMVAPQAAVMRERVAANYGKPLDDATLDAQTRGLALKPDSVATIKRWARAADARVTGQAMYEDLTTDLRPTLAAIQTPITLVYPWNAGGPPKAMTDAFYRKQYAAAPHIRYIDIADAAHMVMLDQPAAFAAALQQFADAPPAG